MKITNIVFRRTIDPLAVPFVTALRRVESLVSLVLELETDEGLTGIGGAAPTEAITGESLATLEAAFAGPVTAVCRSAAADDRASIMVELEAALPRESSARAAVSIALYDLEAKRRGVPLRTLLGPGNDCPPTSYTISLDAPEAMARQAADVRGCGFSLLKIKLGGKDGRDRKRMAAIVTAVPAARLRLDPNQGWSIKEARRLLSAFRTAGYPVDFVEQPLPAADIEGMTALRQDGFYPLAADECVFTPQDARRVIDAGAADIINIKLMKTGGLERALEICRLVEAAGLEVMLGCMLEGAASIFPALHLAAAQPVITIADLDAPLLFREMPAELAGLYRGERISCDGLS